MPGEVPVSRISRRRLVVSEIIAWSGGRFVDPKELTIVRDGGTLDRGEWMERLDVMDYPQFEVGHEYVLFLRWHAEHDAWTPAWGPHGTFEVKSERVRSIGSAEIAKKQNGLTIDEFLTKMRRLP